MDRPVADPGPSPRRHGCLVCLDSDGCVFDSMAPKHRECFLPAFLAHFGLAADDDVVAETWRYVNLDGPGRGANRFHALGQVLALLRDRPEPVARGMAVPALPGLAAWLATESRPSTSTLAARARTTGDPDLARLLDWSREVDRRIAALGPAATPPFPGVREFLAEAAARADLRVVSLTPHDALAREWREHGLATPEVPLGGQELGGKAEQIRAAVAAGGYPPRRVLMVGDAPGDLAAARANAALFFPIRPGAEPRCWAELRQSGLPRLLAGTFAGSYQDRLLAEFEQALTTTPPWRKEI